MKTKIILYSRSGRNESLAEKIAKELNAEIVRVTTTKNMSIFKIILDLLFNKDTEINFQQERISPNDFVIFMGPVWFGKISFPLRTSIKQLAPELKKFALVSLSGGGDGPESNPGLEEELKTITGKNPFEVINLHIADFIEKDEKSTPKEVSDYELTEKDLNELTKTIVNKLRN